MVEQYAQGSYGMTPTKDGDFVKYQDYKQALAAKDLALAQANRHKEELFQKLAEKDREVVHLQDVYTKQRHKQEDDYQQLMEQAIRLAKYLDQCPAPTLGKATAQAFLQSPEVQAWKEWQK